MFDGTEWMPAEQHSYVTHLKSQSVEVWAEMMIYYLLSTAMYLYIGDTNSSLVINNYKHREMITDISV